MREGEYHGTHYYWDSEEREYTLLATWFFEKNYPEMPDYWILKDLEVQDQEPRSPDIDVSEGSDVWCYVDLDGPPIKLEEVHYI